MAEPGAPISNLACSLAQLAALIEVLPTGIACHGGEKMILANQAMCEITGYSREQLLAMNFWELAHPRFQSLLRERGESRVRGTAAPARYEVVLVTARGEERWLDLLATAVKVDGRTIAIASYLDNTERKRAETRHMHARQELAQIIDSNPMPTFVIDHEHLITHWNKACEHMIGIKAADMVGTRNHQKVFYGKERLTMADLIVDGSMEARIRQMYRDKRLTRSQLIDGAYEAEDFFPHFGESGQWLYFAAAPLTDADGHLIGAVETLQDFTEQRFAESEMIKSKRELEALVTARGEQLREATRELEQDIARRETAEAELLQRFNELSALNAELKQAQQQLVQSEKLASIGQLAAGVAHEINNPIGFVQSNLGSLERYFEQIMALLDGYQEGEALLGGLVKDQEGGRVLMDKMQQLKKDTELDYLKEDIPALLKESRDGIVRVKQIVADLKDFSRVDSTQEWEWADIRTGLNSTLNIVSNEIKYRADVVKEYGELPAIKCLPPQLNQVFMNLLVNAAQATPEGRHGTITIRCGAEAEGVWVEISDTGAGIPEKILKQIFDPFFTTKPIGKGTGLGLSLSYGIVQKHGGTIKVESEVGVGTTFRISLPIEPPESATES
ncbi:MAG: PAS domain S-box protein [Burkholderiaceae bacterium]|nr:PAS domain S-box protein [Sulfuritalea sp.]MCF8175931.1 PAS domain S-box protein [Burkholderiaceae bacterium]